MKTFTLKSGTQIPALGFGTWQLHGQDAVNAVKFALNTGYRHLDAAARYENQTFVGKGIKESGISRNNIFVTSKIFYDSLQPDQIVDSCKKTLEELDLEYLDLLLLHWPNRNIPMKDQLQALDDLRQEGLTKSIGVSNYTVRHLKEALATGIEFSVNQVEFHPSLNQNELKIFCENNNITITAYSPIAQGQDLKLSEVLEIAKKYNKTPSQIVLNWIMSKGIAVIPRSAKKEHIKDNFGALGWKMETDDIEKLSGLNRDNRLIDPEWSEFE